MAFQVKRIEVLPGSRLSYQTRRDRAEHWVVVTGRATGVLDGTTCVLEPVESLDIAIGQAHRIWNDTTSRSGLSRSGAGAYLGADDILRHDDDFGRA